MNNRPQAQKAHRKVRLRIRRRVDELDITYGSLAAAVDHDLAVVSKAINYGCYPRVLLKVRTYLHV